MSGMRDGQRWVTVAQAAKLMGVHRETARRRLREHLMQKRHDGKRQDCVMLSRVRAIAIPVAEDTLSQTAELLEMKAQINALQRAQLKLARGLALVASKLGVVF